MAIESVYYLGQVKTYGYLAARKLFPDLAENAFIGVPHQGQICAKVEATPRSVGVLAIENSVGGVVFESLLNIERSSRRRIRVVGELDLSVEFGLFSKSGRKEEIKKILAHSVALLQCEKAINRFREINAPESEIIVQTVNSNGHAAEGVKNDSNAAALTSFELSKEHDLKEVEVEEEVRSGKRTGINNCRLWNDHKNSTTRFWIIARQEFPVDEKQFPGQCNGLREFRTALLVYLDRERTGVLCKALSPFADARIPMFNLVPCVIPGRQWEYHFLFELGGHIDDPILMAAYDELLSDRELCPVPPSYLGSFPDLVSRFCLFSSNDDLRRSAIQRLVDGLQRLYD